MERCEKYPFSKKNIERKNKPTQSTLVFGDLNENGKRKLGSISNSHSLGHWKYDQKICRKELAKMIIKDELPFRFVEHEGFRDFISSVQPRFQIPSRIIIARDCLGIYLEEQTKLMKYIGKFAHRISLTTYTWTSCQNLNYMSLTGHFIDDEWNLQKRILNFCFISGHSGEVIGKGVEKCLSGWKINNVFTITVDNAAPNDVGI